MSEFIDLTGKRFGKLVVIKLMKEEHYRVFRWLCHCDCGSQKPIRGDYLRSGHTVSCGCLRKEILDGNNYHFKHGHTHPNSSTYTSWMDMRNRCHYHNHVSYNNYGARGIKVCNRWLNFKNFLKDMGERPDGKTIHRINNDGNYESGNVKWATRKEQENNKIRPIETS